MTYSDVASESTYGWSPAYPGSTPSVGWNTLTVTFPGTEKRRITELKTFKKDALYSALKGFQAWCITDETTGASYQFYSIASWKSNSWRPYSNSAPIDCRQVKFVATGHGSTTPYISPQKMNFRFEILSY